MNTKVCERCDKEMKFVPAGFSRSKNRPYPAFWSCDRRSGGCGATVNADGNESETFRGGGETDRLAAIETKLDEILTLLKS